MKTLLLLFITTISFVSSAQDTPDKQMEKRAREMHRAILLSDKEAWRKFIKENYTQTLIDKPMRAQVQTSEDTGNGASTTSQSSSADNLEGKVGMYARLHEDFKNSTIRSIRPTTDGLEMTVDSHGGLVGVFTLRFDMNADYRIDGLGIAVEAR
jgi:hypothetical protein